MKDFEMVVFREGLYFREERLECLRVLLLFKDWSSPNGNRISCEILYVVRTVEGRHTLVVFDLVRNTVINRLKHYSVRSRRQPTAQERTHPELAGFVTSVRPRALDLVREPSLLVLGHLGEGHVGDIEQSYILLGPIRWVNRTHRERYQRPRT